MKINILNFGPIRQYSFDLDKDLHLIFGENNVGKSYAITIVYLVIKSFLKLNDFVSYPFYMRGEFNDLIEPSCVDNSDITNIVMTNLKKLFESTFLISLQDSFSATFDSLGNLQNQFTKDPLSIELYTGDIDITIILQNKNLIGE